MTDKRAKIEFLDTLFASRRSYSRQELLKRFEEQFPKGFCRRTFFNYIRELKNNGAPLECKKVKSEFGTTTHYYYEEKFNLNNRVINKYDAHKIKSALTVLLQFEHLPPMQDLKEVILKMENQLDNPTESESPTLLFEHKPVSSGVQWLRILHGHIVKKEVIKMHYEPFQYDEKDHTRWQQTGFEIVVHPYFLKESKNLWYIFGFNHLKKKVENYALDRIKHIEKAPHYFFKPNETIDSHTYFNDIVGVTKFDEQTLENFVIRANPIIAPYWVNRPLHATQRLLEETPQYSLFSFDLRWNYEWQNLILSYGANVEVQQPFWFRERLKEIYQALYEKYQ